MELRQFEERHFEGASRLSRAFYEGKHGSFSLLDMINGKRMLTKYVLTDTDSAAVHGYALLAEQISPKVRLRMELVLEPGFKRKELFEALYAPLMSNVEELCPYSLEARMFADNMEEIDFFIGKGFNEDHRMVKKKLDVANARIDDYSHLEKNLHDKGIEIRTLAEEKTSARDCMERMERLVQETSPDFPNELPAYLRQPSYDTSWLYGSDIIPEAFFIAVREGRYVGYSHLMQGPEQMLIQSNTAVHRDFRSQGIATALKIRGIRFARANGSAGIYTSNRSTNDPMSRVNRKLGWVEHDSELRMQKVINPGFRL